MFPTYPLWYELRVHDYVPFFQIGVHCKVPKLMTGWTTLSNAKETVWLVTHVRRTCTYDCRRVSFQGTCVYVFLSSLDIQTLSSTRNFVQVLRVSLSAGTQRCDNIAWTSIQRHGRCRKVTWPDVASTLPWCCVDIDVGVAATLMRRCRNVACPLGLSKLISLKCSETCARGTKTREVKCYSSADSSTPVADSQCTGAQKPVATEYCVIKPCRTDISKYRKISNSSGCMTFIQRRINVDATWWCRIDVDATSGCYIDVDMTQYQCCVSAGNPRTLKRNMA